MATRTVAPDAAEMAKSDHVKQHLPHLAQQHAIALESSSGIQCFLRDVPATWPSFMRPGIFTECLAQCGFDDRSQTYSPDLTLFVPTMEKAASC
nr:hypothetical protein [Mycobacterium haemophilum]